MGDEYGHSGANSRHSLDPDPADAGLYPYELVLTPGKGCGAEFRDAVEDGTFDRAVAAGRSA